MADILITAVSASYTGTENADDIQNSTGNLRDITVAGLSGDDLLSFGSAVQAGTADGGRGLGFSIGSSDLNLGAGNDTMTFSGQAGSGFSQYRSNNTRLGAGDDFLIVNGLASASGSTIRGNEGADEITFAAATAGQTAESILLNGNAGADSISAVWTGQAQSFTVLGGTDNDTIRATFSAVSAVASAINNQSGAKIGGNKGNDSIFVNAVGTSEQIRINGNSGDDTIVVTAAADSNAFGVAGGRGNDVVSAVFANASTALGATVAGSLGNDTVTTTFSGGFASGFLLNGASGNDALTFNNVGVALTLGGGNSIAGGTGADTINFNIGADVTVTGASGFVVDLGAPGIVSGGTSTAQGGVLNVSLSADLIVDSGASVFFRGTNTGDDVNVTLNSAGAINGATFSADDGADSITLTTTTAGGLLSGAGIFAGAGADLITAQFAAATNVTTTTGGLLTIDAGDGADTLLVNVTSAGSVSAGIFNGGSGADVITIDLISGSDLETVNTGTVFDAGSGADTIGLAVSNGSTADTQLRAGDGADLITATFQTAGGVQGANGIFTADAGAGNDTINVTVVGVSTAGGNSNDFRNLSAGVVAGGAGDDSITVLFDYASAASTVSLGQARGGDGADTITFGSIYTDTADNAVLGSFNGGAGADSLIFSGNNMISGAVHTFGSLGGSAGFVFASGDSTVGGFDVVSVANSAATGGNAMSQGTFGSAGFLFTGFNDSNAGNFDMGIATAGVTAGVTDAIFLVDSAGSTIVATAGLMVKTGGVVGAHTGGGAGDDIGIFTGGSAQIGTFMASGGSTTGEIFSAVDALAVGRGKAAAFNIQNGSAGSIDGFVFIQGGTLTDNIVKFQGHGVAAGNAVKGDYYFTGGLANGLNYVVEDSDSGGQVFFGANVGVG